MYILNCWGLRSARRLISWWLTAMVVYVLAGCGGEPDPLKGMKFYPTKGTVLLAGGKPLTSGNVVFVATKSTITSTAAIGPDGTFTFKNASGDGLPEGEYRVRIEVTSTTVSGGKAKATLPFATHYLDEDASNLKATVTPDESKNNFEFKLDTKTATPATAGQGGK
jgi:hypothetical protein